MVFELLMSLRKYLMLDQILKIMKYVHVRTTVEMKATEHFLLHKVKCFVFNVLTLNILSDTQLTPPVSSVLISIIL